MPSSPIKIASLRSRGVAAAEHAVAIANKMSRILCLGRRVSDLVSAANKLESDLFSADGVRRLPRPRLCADGVGTMQESTTTRLGLEPRILETATACCATATAQQAVAFFVLA